MGFKRPLVQIQSLGPKSSDFTVKCRKIGIFYLPIVADSFVKFHAITNLLLIVFTQESALRDIIKYYIEHIKKRHALLKACLFVSSYQFSHITPSLSSVVMTRQ